jgi:hypothetical protein
MDTSAAAGRNKCVSLDAFKGFNRGGFAAYLRKLYPYDTAANIAADLKISDRTVDNWLSETSEPRSAVLLQMAGRYGLAVLAASYHKAPPWLDPAARAVRMAELEAELAALRGKDECR